MERVVLDMTSELMSFAVFVTSFVTGLILVVMTKRVCHRIGISDQPDGRLKVHDRKVVSLGGIPISISVLLSGYLAFSNSDLHITNLAGILMACGVILSLGVYDDIFQIKPFTKLCFQTVAALMFVLPGTPFRMIDFFGIFDFSCGAFAIPLAMFWIVGSCNAFNFMDGMDGLASGVSMIICLCLAALGFINGNYTDAIMAISLAGALAAILVFNYHPASIFLGDSGSQLTGLLIGILSLRILSLNAVFMLPVAYTMLSLPVLDTMMSILRRFSTFRPIYQGDLSHIHHCVRARGLNVRAAAWVLWLVASIGCVISLSSVFLNHFVAFALSSVYLAGCVYLAVKIGCLSVHKLLYRLRINIKPATAVDRFNEIESLWEKMKPLFEKIRLDRAVMTLEGVNSFGRPEYKTLQWVRNESIVGDFPTDCWTTRFYLDKEEREMVILQLQSIEKDRRHDENVNWLLNRISTNMRMTNEQRKIVLEEKDQELFETIHS
ncbi:MAG: undecaprenyl/decaprenyl-phosphate alpha-N-acetylglucosaminyl 1-phosphate transferase [Sedimentisphaerales bacterium]|nr:undecaprenyl/decaprenyl-phosphate alpha-N-acetylglucosaminyl 1-phosphate transferase [Sedimentisphaerales bacterium]